MVSLKDKLKLGATGSFPQGKLNATDEGAIRMAVSSANGLVRIDFGTPTAWVAFSANEAKELAAIPLRHADGGVSQ